jgi:enoyl-CoA hydratase/carnithine racemase
MTAGAAQTELVLRHLEDGVGTLSFNRPAKHNAMNGAMRDEWASALEWAKSTPDVRVIIVRGEGRSFCSGRDMSDSGIRSGSTGHRERIEKSQAIRLSQLEAGKPVIASLRGNVIGGGAEIALAADFRVAATDLKFSLPEVSHGLVVDTGGSANLTALAGPARAKWALMSGEPIGCEQAMAWGLVEWIVSPDELDSFSLALARKLAAKPPNALRLGKDLVDQIWARDLRGSLHRELLAQLSLLAGEEYREISQRRRLAHAASRDH